MKRKTIFTTFVLALLAITVATTEAQEKLKDLNIDLAPAAPDFRPKGVFALVNHGKAPADKIWTNPCIDGVRISRKWKQLNPGPDSLNWNELDRMFAKADTFGKRIHLMVIPGFESPKWVLDEVDTMNFRHNPGKEKEQPLPIPWRAKYLKRWFAFVDTLGKRYGSRPELSLIAITGPNSQNGEVVLPSHSTDIDKWRTIIGGGNDWEDKLKDTMLAAYEKTIDRFRNAFAAKDQKYFSMQIVRHALPIERKNQKTQNSYQESLKCYAYRKLGKYFVLMNGGLEGKPVYPQGEIEPNVQWVKVLKWSVQSDDEVVGYQTRIKGRLYPPGADESKQRQIFEYTIRNGIGYGGDFIEIYDDDIEKEYLQDWIAYASVFMGGQLSKKEVERKCECLKSVKFKIPL
jgi:hypothetical protein